MHFTNFSKAIILTSIASWLAIFAGATIQLLNMHSVSKCSYLDPITVDIFAFGAAIFLVIEGFYKIIQNRDEPIAKQATRSIRIAFGFAIITIHIIQFATKIIV